MEKENATWRIIATYKGKDDYGLGTIQEKTIKKEFDTLSDLRDWIFKNDSIEDFIGHNVTTILHLFSYKTYKIECVECYEDKNSFTSFSSDREFRVGDVVLHVVSDVRIKSPLKGVVKSISYGRYMDVEFDGYGTQTFDFDDMSVYKE